MLTFSVNDINLVYNLKVHKTIEENIQYFKKFNGPRFMEAINKAYEVAITHNKAEYDVLEPYIKNLARNILKEQIKESPMDTVNEDGEVSYPFLKLTTTIDEDVIELDTQEIMDTFKILYLTYDEDFEKLKELFKREDDKFSKSEIIKNEAIQEAIRVLRNKYNAQHVYTTLYDFFKKLPEYTMEIENGDMKYITLTCKEQEFLSSLPDIPMIVDEDGNFYSLDKYNLRMRKNPDTFRWDVITPTSCDIVRVDIAPLMDYMYEQIYVPKGVRTKHIFWCDNMYRLTTPGGKRFVNIDREKFITAVKFELVSNFVNNRLNTIIAISPDYIYIKPTRMFQYDTIRIETCRGHIIDLPVEIYLKKRK